MSIFETLFGNKNLLGKNTPELPDGTGPWFNLPAGKVGRLPLKIKGLTKEGRTILIDFWTYSCVNCLRTLPYLKIWHEKYSPAGLVIIGVHTPEFEFEKEPKNVEKFIKEERLKYPVVLDSDRKIWDLFGNNAWPRKLLIDTKGKIRYDHSGEGAYIETENKIRELLKETNPDVSLPRMGTKEHEHIKAGAVCYPQTPETYCSYLRGRLGNKEGYIEDKFHVYKIETKKPLEDGKIYLNGGWIAKPEYLQHGVKTRGPINHLIIPFHGLEANVVIKLDETKLVSETRVYIAVDEKPLTKESAGKDILFDGANWSYLKVEEPRMYQIFKTAEFGDHRLKIIPFSDAVQIYAFTFGGCVE